MGKEALTPPVVNLEHITLPFPSFIWGLSLTTPRGILWTFPPPSAAQVSLVLHCPGGSHRLQEQAGTAEAGAAGWYPWSTRKSMGGGDRATLRAPCQPKPCSAPLPAKVERLPGWHFTCIFPSWGYEIKIPENFNWRSLWRAQSEGTTRQAELLHSHKAHSNNMPRAVLQNPCFLQPAGGLCALEGNISN